MADFRTALEILLKAKDETKAATTSAGVNLGSLSQHITAVSTAFLAIRQAAQDALGVVDAIIGGAVREADAFDSLAQRIGVSASSLSEIKFASDVAGVSFETTSRVLETLTRRIGDIAIKGDGEATPALKRLGISLDEIVNLKADEQLQVILEALGDVANASERAAIATALFGRGGTEIVELSGRMKELRQTARDVGAAMDEEFIAKAVAARERFKEFEGAVKGVRNQLAERILMEISDEELQKALDALTKLSDLASKTITFILDVAFADTEQAQFFRRLLFGFTPEITGAVVKAVAITKQAADDIATFVQDTTEKLEELGAIGSAGAPFAVHFKLDDDGSVAQTQADLKAAADAAAALEAQQEAAARAAAEMAAHVREVLAAVDATADATDRQLVATASVAGHWDEISRAAALALKTQADVTAELEGMLEAGLSLDEAWARINEQLGVSTTRTLELVGAMEQVEPAVVAIRHEFDFFAASIEEMNDRLAHSIAQQTEELGANVTAMIGNSLDQMANMWASNIVFGRKWAETIKQIFKQLVADILAELAKLAAKKLAFGFLNLILPGAGSVGAALEGLNRAQPQQQQSVIDIPQPIVEPPQITFREPEPITFPTVEITLPRPEVIPPEVRIIPAAPVEFPAIEVQAPEPILFLPMELHVPQPEVVPPEVHIFAADPVAIPAVEVQAPGQTIVPPEVSVEAAAPIEFPPITVAVPTPAVVPPEIDFIPPAAIVFPPVELVVPAPTVTPPDVSIQPPAPIEIPTIDVSVPPPSVLPPEIRIAPAEDFLIPPIDVEVPAPVVLGPEIRMVEPETLVIPPIDVSAPLPTILGPEVLLAEPEPIIIPALDLVVPTPTVIGPQVSFVEPAAVVIPPIQVQMPQPEVVTPPVIFQPPPLIAPPPIVSMTPQLLTPPPSLLAPTETRNMFFNLTVNTGFSSRGVGLETARQILPFLREVAGGGL